MLRRLTTPLPSILYLSILILFCASFTHSEVARGVVGADPTFLAREAREQYYQGNLEKSIALLTSALPTAPEWVAGELLALILETGRLGVKNNLEQTLKMLEEIFWPLAQKDPSIAQELFTAALLLGEQERASWLLPFVPPSAETLFFQGFLALQRGQAEEAVSFFQAYLNLDNRKSASWYFLGRAYLSLGKLAEGEKAFQEAWNKDPNFTPAYLLLAQTQLSQGKLKEGYAHLNRLQHILPSREEIREQIRTLEEQLPELVAKIQEEASARRRIKTPATPTTFVGDPSRIPIVRVSLAEGLKHLYFKTASPYLIRWNNDSGQEEQKELSPGEYKISLDTRELHMYTEEGTKKKLFSMPFTTPVLLDPVLSPDSLTPSSTVLFFDLLTERGSFFASVQDRSYRGSFQIVPSSEGFSLINWINLEEYLYSVLPSEIPASWPMEALKAQAIAARSYTLAMMEAAKSRSFDVYGGTRSASYKGVENEHPRTTQAVDSTRGQVLKTARGYLSAFYYANSGGYGESSAVVWGYTDTFPPVPDALVSPRSEPLSLVQLTYWLRSSPPTFASWPGLHFPESYRWERWVTPEDILNRLGKEAPPGRITAILTRGRGISGRVKEIEIRTEGGAIRLKGDRIRIVLGGLRSTLFTLRTLSGLDGYPEYFIFTGGGWGHGVGMDQSGAAGMAANGYLAEEILKHYYPKAQLDTYLL
ncbi:MAG: SpoIID/LytB domain-containing protein [Spirochaetales bacterium]